MTDAFPATFFYADLHAKSGTVPFHQHDGCEILLVLRGKCRVESPIGTLEGNAGDLLVVPPGIRHNQLSEPGERNFFCVFRAETGLFRQEWRKIHLAAPGFARRTLLELQTMNLRNERSGADALLCSLLQRISARDAESPEFPPALRSALEYFQRHYTENISVEDAAKHAGICPSFLRRLFQRHCGESPRRHLLNLRLERARVLLCNPGLSIEEIAEQCGFENSSYFIRFYRKCTGSTPGHARISATSAGVTTGL